MSIGTLLPFADKLRVLDGDATLPLPDWAVGILWIGNWARIHQFRDKRLIVFVVLPTRRFAAAFAGLGCLIAGARTFRDELSWRRFRALPPGQSVFWKQRSGSGNYQGNIVGFTELDGSQFIEVRITKAPRKAEVGVLHTISESTFEGYHFSEERPPTAMRSVALEEANSLIETLVGGINDRWMWSDGAEGIVLTSVVSFQRCLEDIRLAVDGRPPMAMSDLLCLGRNRDQVHAKFRIIHPRGKIDGQFPLTILDGAEALSVHEHVGIDSNLLIFLDRSEYQEDVHSLVQQLRAVSFDYGTNEFPGDLPDRFPPGFEIAAFLVSKG